MAEKEHIIFIHLLNDFSGSPRVLSQVIKGFVEKSYKVEVFTSRRNEPGFLSGITGVNYKYFFYRWSRFKIVTLIFFFLSQISLFLKLLAYRNKNVTIYVNTILPIGGALAGKLMGKRVIYHVHETSVSPLLFKKFLFLIAEKCASEAIYVSYFLLNQERLKGVNCHVVYNALSKQFLSVAEASPNKLLHEFRVLMLSSLKAYKGVFEFIHLARKLPMIKFEMVINANLPAIEKFFRDEQIPANLTIFPFQKNVHPFYQRADLVVNLSHPLQWVETFGLTALEAMTYGLPVIVPPVGGIAEIVNQSKCGLKVDVREIDLLEDSISNLASNKVQYDLMSKEAKIRAGQFVPKEMLKGISSIVENNHSPN